MHVQIYTDASYHPQEVDGSCGIVIFGNQSYIASFALYFQDVNSALTAELIAINTAIDYVRRNTEGIESIHLVTDSSRAARIWNGRAKDDPNISITWLRGHSKIFNPNNLADRLAALSYTLKESVWYTA